MKKEWSHCHEKLLRLAKWESGEIKRKWSFSTWPPCPVMTSFYKPSTEQGLRWMQTGAWQQWSEWTAVGTPVGLVSGRKWNMQMLEGSRTVSSYPRKALKPFKRSAVGDGYGSDCCSISAVYHFHLVPAASSGASAAYLFNRFLSGLLWTGESGQA